MKHASVDLTEGPIVKTLLRLVTPIMASSFLGAAYNIMDMAWVGTLGAKAVAGVGVAGMFLWLSGGLSTLPRMGGQVNSSQAIGRRDLIEAKNYAKAAMQLAVFLGFAFALVSLLFTHQMVGFFNLNDAESTRTAISYTRITCGLIVFSFVNLTLTGLYTAQGDSVTPLKANATGLTINMVLDPMMIKGLLIFPKLGSDGAAIATVTAQVIVTIVLVYKMREPGRILFKDQDYLRLAPSNYFHTVFKIGTPAALQSMAYCSISMVLSRFIASFGPEAMAVVRVGNQIEAITWNTAEGFSSALNSFCGQNFGAGKYDRIRKGYVFSAIASFAWGSIVLAGFVFAPEFITRIFFFEPKAIAISISYLVIIGLSEPFMAVEIIGSGALSGLGKTKLCSIISITLTALRIPIAFVLMGTPLGVSGIWWALSSTSIVKGIVFTIAFQNWAIKNK